MEETLESIITDLDNHLIQLRDKFLKLYLEDRTSTPDEYDTDVKAYCVLCHAAFEEFFETVALKVLDKSINLYLREKKITEPLVTLMHFKAKAKHLDSDFNRDDCIRIFDYMRERLDELKKTFSSEITEQNHGITTRHLRQLLTPLSIGLTNDFKIESLDKLTKERGLYAHRYKEGESITKSIAPEDAKKIVGDCFDICKDIKEKALKIIPDAR